MHIREISEDSDFVCWSIEANGGSEWFRYNHDMMPADIKQPLFADFQKIGDHVSLTEEEAVVIAYKLRLAEPRRRFRVRKINIRMTIETVATFG